MPVYFGGPAFYNNLHNHLKGVAFIMISTVKKITGIVIACLFIFSLSSCGFMKKSQIVGTYDLVSATGNGVSITESQMDTMKALGMTATLEVRDDGTATMDLFGEKMELTYNLNKMVFSSNGSDAKFTFDGTEIAFSEDGTSLVFTKRQ